MEYVYKNNKQFEREDELTHPIFDMAFQPTHDKIDWFIKYKHYRSIDKYWKYNILIMKLDLP